MKIYIYLFVATFFYWSSAHAQSTQPPRRNCGSEVNWNTLKANPVRWREFLQREESTKQRMQELSRTTADPNQEYVIPVVFHIVDPNPADITDLDVEIQMAILNADYEGINDSTNSPLFYPVRGRTKIRFELAKRTPDGCETNGITRTTSFLTITNASRNLIKHTSSSGHDAWDSYNNHYLNIWVGNFGLEPDNTRLLGVATFPDDPIPTYEQGVIIGRNTFSLSGGAFTEGRTLTHEVGHFFNLRHIWGDAAGCATDDFIDDTPLQDVSTGGGNWGLVTDVCSAVSPGINYQNFMDYSYDTSLTMFTKKQALRMLASLDHPLRSILYDRENKALVPPTPNEYFNMCTNPVFTTNDFYGITVGKGGVVWAGTSRQGIYKYSSTGWEKYSAYTNNLVWDMKADQKGGVWVAQAGFTSGSNTAQTGGVNYFPDSNFNGAIYYGVLTDGLPSRYARSLFIDTTRYNTGTNPLVWTGNMANNTAGVSSNGGVGRGLNAAAPGFTTIRAGLDVATTTQSVNAVGGNASEVWAVAPVNFGKTQILKYNAATNALIGAVDNTTNPTAFPSANFDARSIYFDNNNRKWIGLWGGGFVVNEGANWYLINSPQIIPASARVNANAITGDKAGNVYIGTDSGLIVFKGGSVRADTNYKRYTTDHGLPHNNVRGVCVDTLRKKILLATQNGIAFWEPKCAEVGNNNMPYVTTASGDLNSAATWCGGVVPPPNSKIIVRHNLTISNNLVLKSLKAEPGGVVTVAAGVLLTITE